MGLGLHEHRQVPAGAFGVEGCKATCATQRCTLDVSDHSMSQRMPSQAGKTSDRSTQSETPVTDLSFVETVSQSAPHPFSSPQDPLTELRER